MFVSLDRFKCTATQALTKAGYTKRPKGDWVRRIEDIRYHIHVIDPKNFQLHIDIFTGDTHFAPPMPIAEKKEVKRILKGIYYSLKKPQICCKMKGWKKKKTK